MRNWVHFHGKFIVQSERNDGARAATAEAMMEDEGGAEELEIGDVRRPEAEMADGQEGAGPSGLPSHFALRASDGANAVGYGKVILFWGHSKFTPSKTWVHLVLLFFFFFMII